MEAWFIVLGGLVLLFVVATVGFRITEPLIRYLFREIPSFIDRKPSRFETERNSEWKQWERVKRYRDE
ncbi:hypothetical protein [Salinithrix halophila]|uniref:Uncharacterized protein n=1 Tax=Salinithrix halophila TaxID=1485204 RepID=A0ABV8JD69_9BACL